jgi:hypothetical protein
MSTSVVAPGQHRPVHAAPWAPVLDALRGIGHTLAAHRSLIVGCLVVAAAAAALLAAARQRRGHSVHRGRVRAVLVPTESFAPTDDEIVRFASTLAQARVPSPLLTPGWCRAIRFGMTSVEGILAYYVEVPPWMASSLRTAVFPEVELHPVSVLEELAGRIGPKVPASAAAEDGDAEPEDDAGDDRPGGSGDDGVDSVTLDEDLDDDELVAVP